VPLSRTSLVGLLCVACALVAGCGSSSTASPPKVRVSLSAPTDGATVNVSNIEVLGTVAPENAVLIVSGQHVRVRHGAFKMPMSLRKGLTHIKIEARATGFVRSSTVILVRYSPPRHAAPGSPQPPTSVPASGVSQGGGTLPPGARAEAISRCSDAGGGNASVCTCVFDRLSKAGFNTQAQWQALAESWRRSLLASGVIRYPPVMKNAIVACAQEFGGP
jgi:hypothetical protein